MKVAPNLGLGLEKSEEHVRKSLLQKFNMPVDHLSYDYVGNCVDGRELERILKILRSGEEGSYPDLIAFAECQLTKVRPDSKLLRKQEAALEPGALEPDVWKEIYSEIQAWTAGVTQTDKDLAGVRKAGLLPDVAAPVRSGVGRVDQVNQVDQESTMIDYEENLDDPQPSCSRTVKTRKPYCRRATDWNAYDADRALTQMGLEEERLREAREVGRQRRGATAHVQPLPRYEDASKVAQGMYTVERKAAAAVRRQAGNECFNAGDLAQAAQHYTASLALYETCASYTNRALIFLRQDLFRDCVADCTSALLLDCISVKALYRRACALGKMGATGEALADARAVLRLDPNSKPARDLVRQLAGREETWAQKPNGGRRMQISEVIEDEKPSPPKIIELSSEAVVDSSTLQSGSSIKPSEVGAGGDAVGIGESVEETGGTELPKEKVDLPGERAELPGDKAELPKDKAKLSGNKAELPKDKAELPKDKDKLPGDKAELPKSKAELPKDDAELPLDQAELPLGNVGAEGRTAIEQEGSGGGFRQTVVKERLALDSFPDALQHEGMFFLHAWSTLHQHEDLLQHAKLLNSIKPEDLYKAVGPALDQKMLSLLLGCLDRQAYVFSPDARLAYLANIVGLQRFDVAACFMEAQDHAALENICKLLFEQGSPVPAEVIAAFNQW